MALARVQIASATASSGPSSSACRVFLKNIRASERRSGTPIPTSQQPFKSVGDGYVSYTSSPAFFDSILPDNVVSIYGTSEYNSMRPLAGWNSQVIAVQSIGNGMFAVPRSDGSAILSSLKASGLFPNSVDLADGRIEELSSSPLVWKVSGTASDAAIEAKIFPTAGQQQSVFVMYPVGARTPAVDKVLDGLTANNDVIKKARPEGAAGRFGFAIATPKLSQSDASKSIGGRTVVEFTSPGGDGVTPLGSAGGEARSPVAKITLRNVSDTKMRRSEQIGPSRSNDVLSPKVTFRLTQNGREAKFDLWRMESKESVALVENLTDVEACTFRGAWEKHNASIKSTVDDSCLYLPVFLPASGTINLRFNLAADDGEALLSLKHDGQFQTAFSVGRDADGIDAGFWDNKTSDYAGARLPFRSGPIELAIEIEADGFRARVNGEPAGVFVVSSENQREHHATFVSFGGSAEGLVFKAPNAGVQLLSARVTAK